MTQETIDSPLTEGTAEEGLRPPADADAEVEGVTDGDAANATSTRRRWWYLAVAAGVAIVALLAATSGGTAPTQEATATETNTAEVVLTDLSLSESFSGTLGTVDGDPITASTAGIVTAVASEGSTVGQGGMLYEVGGEPVALLYGDTPAYRTLALGSDWMTVSAGSTGVVTAVVELGSIIEQGETIYWLNGEPVVLLYGDVPAFRKLEDARTDLVGSDVLQLEQALASLGFDDNGSMTVDGVFTGATEDAVEEWQESIGAVVDGVVEFGYVVFAPGPIQLIEIHATVGQSAGSNTPIVTLSSGELQSGPDVQQMEVALSAMGFDADGDLTVDGIFDAATVEAIAAFQASFGQTADGVVQLGEVVFRPDAIRVSEILATPGSTVNNNAPVLSTSSALQAVRVDVPAADQSLIDEGTNVTVVLPDFREVSGTVASIAAAATVGQNGEATFEAIVELDDPTAAGTFDEAPVTVDVVAESVHDVLAVPVTALIALAEGGYAVEIDTGAGHQLVAVEPGFFADGMVEISGSGIEPGMIVVLP